MTALERAVHPLVDAERAKFIEANASADVIVFDIPLLYEKGYEGTVDAVVVVSTGNEELQRERVLKRVGMTREKLDGILARQVPDAEKRARADYVIDTSCSLDETRAAVEEMLATFIDKTTTGNGTSDTGSS
jgi:dephospho-CoA kinase